MPEQLHQLWRRLAEVARLMVGVPDYAAYLARRQQCAAHAPVLSRAEFVRHCNQRRLGGRGPGRCC